MNMPRLMSGARPTGGLHIAQYFSAYKPFVESEIREGSFFIVSDLHMLTTKFTRSSTEHLKAAVRNLVAEAIGFGINPEETTFYLQSQVPWQARIYAIIQSLAPIQRLTSQVSFDEMARHASNIRPPTLGLLGYPVLESSDVISIGATHVTVGDNNVGHFELMREILQELAASWEISFEPPELIVGRRNLIGTDGSEKMSKSLGNAIFFSDSIDAIRSKIQEMALLGDDGIMVPVEYFRVLGTDENRCNEVGDSIRSNGSVTSDIRDDLTQRIWGLVEPIQDKVRNLLANPEAIDEILATGCIVADGLGRNNYEALVKGLDLPRFESRDQM
jgi:tryptophanyl-tRNA synthetase